MLSIDGVETVGVSLKLFRVRECIAYAVVVAGNTADCNYHGSKVCTVFWVENV